MMFAVCCVLAVVCGVVVRLVAVLCLLVRRVLLEMRGLSTVFGACCVLFVCGCSLHDVKYPLYVV